MPTLLIVCFTMALAVGGCSRSSSSAPPAPDNSKKSSPTVQVQAYQIDGETFLPPEKLSGALTRNTGTVDPAQISVEAKELQEVYRQAGYTNVRVVIPPQRFTNGIVHFIAVKQ